ncbi:exodeoxyribonuclease VII small subunit [Guyparkeria sp. SCN-R1]|uniref:exodeoxyribonuclease VII small subunit n=1 Tax=Guyparkeria sp. SCN-R1 TaxID=2341113 RepID=UPI000F650ECF|nr:exodeoxyribonuclease VII small subunit [Guyparkeria sp. SCN-R1]RRQ23745.1 exodeoxyribonuclease VII small subunit [Guyparkeria sp. SCN-R1]
MDSSPASKTIRSQTVESGDPSAITRYEQALTELEQIVARLESGEQSLEQSLKDYERGVELERQCQRALDEAERRVAAINDPARDESGRDERSS